MTEKKPRPPMLDRILNIGAIAAGPMGVAISSGAVGLAAGHVIAANNAFLADAKAHPPSELQSILDKIEATIPHAEEEVLKLENVKKNNLDKEAVSKIIKAYYLNLGSINFHTDVERQLAEEITAHAVSTQLDIALEKKIDSKLVTEMVATHAAAISKAKEVQAEIDKQVSAWNKDRQKAGNDVDESKALVGTGIALIPGLLAAYYFYKKQKKLRLGAPQDGSPSPAM